MFNDCDCFAVTMDMSITGEQELFPSSPAIIDGGFGSTLEDLFHVNISQSHLWSGRQILDNPRTVVEAHLAFLRAGAQIILTSTYQCSLATFELDNLSADVARNTMLKGVYLAEEARNLFRKENPDAGDIKIALSLGPFGATLFPAQDYGGIYPPPYGPRAFSDGENTSSYGDDSEGKLDSIEALARFHFERLCVFSDDPGAWGIIDIVAFESVPLVREVKGIRKAMASLQRHLTAKKDTSLWKPWWISFILPDGSCPEERYPGGPNYTVQDLVIAALEGGYPGQNLEYSPIPTGIGINCKCPDNISKTVSEMAAEAKDWIDGRETSLWLVLYPNSGAFYNLAERKWMTGEKVKRDWMEGLLGGIRAADMRIWRGVAAGGCCCIGPDQIRDLKKELTI